MKRTEDVKVMTSIEVLQAKHGRLSRIVNSLSDFIKSLYISYRQYRVLR